jgi:hypothetical protein
MRLCFGACLLAIVTCLGAAPVERGNESPPVDYFVGEYAVIGRSPDSKASYSGTVKLQAQADGRFVMIRKIGGHESRGTAFLAHADPPADRPAVLRIRFNENGKEFEGTFLWRSDLDNYPRLTGFIYQNGKTKSPGLEAWFPAATLPR